MSPTELKVVIANAVTLAEVLYTKWGKRLDIDVPEGVRWLARLYILA
jgi:hypothetical protein